MDKDEQKSTFDVDFDPETNEDFLKNIEIAIGEETKIKQEENELIEEAETNTVVESTIDIEQEAVKEIINTKTKEDEIEEYDDEETTDNISEEMEDEFFDISYILAEQINEVSIADASSQAEDITLNQASSENSSDLEEETKKKSNRFKAWFHRMPLGLKITSITSASLLFLVIIGLFVVFSGLGTKILALYWESQTNSFETNITYENDIDQVDNKTDNENLTKEDDIQWTNTTTAGEAKKEDYVINILLLGEEAIDSYNSRGRTDLIVIATMNKKEKALKLTSLMRDTLVQIPGAIDNKLNSAYEKGGIELLYDTIERNFDIKLDGSVLVGFEGFEDIIDELGGIELTLTQNEAKYLRETNYISNPIYRNVQAGTHTLNGNQALGYSRIRYRATASGQNNDYGRTERHRIVLDAIFQKLKTKSKLELVGTMTKMLPLITTDISSSEFEKLINTFFEIGFSGKIEQLRIPAKGTFTDDIPVRDMDVLIPDLKANIDILHKFIFGEDYVEEAVTTPPATN